MRPALVLAAMLFAAGAARAENPPIAFEASAPTPALRLPQALVDGQRSDLWLPITDRDRPPALPEGVAKTSVDHRFSPSGDVVGSLGYLCGIAKTPDDSGGVASSYEPAGTFLGGQLKVAF